MRRIVLLLLAVACGSSATSTPGAPEAAGSPSRQAGVEAKAAWKAESGGYAATTAGACQHLDDCGCNEAGSVKTCEMQLDLVMKTVDGVMGLQDDVVRAAVGDAPEGGIVSKTVDLAHGVVAGTMAINLQAMTTMDCTELCASMKQN